MSIPLDPNAPTDFDFFMGSWKVAHRRLKERLVGGDSLEVNSRHHQAVKTVAKGFRVVATAPDGVIEAMEASGPVFCLAVQWHPENFWRTGEFRPLFEGFVAACRRD